MKYNITTKDGKELLVPTVNLSEYKLDYTTVLTKFSLTKDEKDYPVAKIMFFSLVYWIVNSFSSAAMFHPWIPVSYSSSAFSRVNFLSRYFWPRSPVDPW